MNGVAAPRLTDTSYAVLALVDLRGPATPYQLKQLAQVSIFHFWSIPHTQIYTECSRLAEAGLLDERREQTGRRPRIYRISAAGRKALNQWRADPEAGMSELRDPGPLNLFCGAEPAARARTQLERQASATRRGVARAGVPVRRDRDGPARAARSPGRGVGLGRGEVAGRQEGGGGVAPRQGADVPVLQVRAVI